MSASKSLSVQEESLQGIKKRPRAKTSGSELRTPVSSLRVAKSPVAPKDGKVVHASLVSEAVNSMRRRILSLSQDNAFLGSEEQLIEELGVSRPTFRQAVRLLEHERLLKIKRGAGGGFFALAPSPEAVSRMAAIYLNSRRTTLRQIGDAVMPLMVEAAALVAESKDPQTLLRLKQYLLEHAGFEDGTDARESVRVVLGFESLLGTLSGNPAIALMMDVMRDLTRDARHSHFQITPDRLGEYVSFIRRVMDAIEQGDAEMARLVVVRHTRQIREWLKAEPPGRVTGSSPA